MLCDHCGKTLPDGIEICDGCGCRMSPARRENGTSIHTQATEQTASFAPPPLSAASTPPPPQPQYGPPPPSEQPYCRQQGGDPYGQPYPWPGYAQNPPAVSVGDWMLTLFLMVIPFVGIIMLFVWAFGNSNPSKKNYARASLLWGAIALILWILIVVLLVAGSAAAM